ncbi:hypothetical protein MAN88_08540 [Microcystis aeruginosa]|nr:hypothetical protein MAN88_08540 [Microcystis aeruginosa]
MTKLILSSSFKRAFKIIIPNPFFIAQLTPKLLMISHCSAIAFKQDLVSFCPLFSVRLIFCQLLISNSQISPLLLPWELIFRRAFTL